MVLLSLWAHMLVHPLYSGLYGESFHQTQVSIVDHDLRTVVGPGAECVVPIPGLGRRCPACEHHRPPTINEGGEPGDLGLTHILADDRFLAPGSGGDLRGPMPIVGFEVDVARPAHLEGVDLLLVVTVDAFGDPPPSHPPILPQDGSGD